ncbi:hypothetical protein SKAU_G00260470 [Synaphobranchus kaupii]|uniref:Ig-like domain-containing protein n=1 Tax=Synaphobranchus kaupii TaxID=118154 RepID=A0A9Q1ISU1_SYNKA|nr:hypothetical protein SKAU_G00260470 [Synaphobranchus kaupii]
MISFNRDCTRAVADAIISWTGLRVPLHLHTESRDESALERHSAALPERTPPLGWVQRFPQQTFEFSVRRLDSPQQEIKIISTEKSNFPYVVYQRRVLNGDIKIQRLTGSSALLEIDNLLEGDGGEYECHTPNTDGPYLGSYSATTVLHVIQDTLSASASPTGLRRAEGESVALECEVSSQTFQHTHLSVTWFLQSDEASQPRPIISLTRDFTLSPGDGFEGRYRAGFISLDKVQETTYRLSISQLQLTDQGSLYCQASEWIQDPDRSWYRIAFKNAEAFTLQIQPIERNLAVSAPSSTTKANEGDVLRVTCSVSGTSGQLSVSWQHRPEQGLLR